MKISLHFLSFIQQSRINKSITLLLLCLLGMLSPTYGQWSNEEHGLEFKGFIDTMQGIRLHKQGDFLSSRTRLRTEAQFYYSSFFAAASLDAVYNAVVNNESGIHLKEAFISYEGNIFDIRMGRQIIIWGKADGFQVTDLISPKDYSEFLARDFDDMRLPVDGFKARFLAGITSFEFIWLPRFTPALVPMKQEGIDSKHSENPWAMVLPATFILNKAQEPAFRLQNSEFAFKFSLASGQVDMGLSYLYVWDDMPVMQLELASPKPIVQPSYKREHVLGLEFSIPAGIAVIRTESAFHLDKYFNTINFGKPIKKHSAVNLVGFDFLPGKGWTISLQVYNVAIFSYEDSLQAPPSDTYLTFHLQKKFLRDTLTLSKMFFFGIENLNLYSRTSVNYAVSDPFHIMFGFDVFYAPKTPPSIGGVPREKRKGNFAPFKENHQFFFKAKYSFDKTL